MADLRCDVCGGSPYFHHTEIKDGVMRQSWYCRDHVPPEFAAGPSDEVRVVEQMIAQADAQEMEPGEKAEFLKELRSLADDIAAGRRRLGDDE